MTRHIVLLRGVNVGRSQRIAMADFRATLTDRGYDEVVTIVASGNAVVTTIEPDAQAVADDVRDALTEHHGLDVTVMARSRDQWAKIMKANPFLTSGAAPNRLFVGVAAAQLPKQAVLDALVTTDVTPERFTATKSEFYVSSPRGTAESLLLKQLTEKRVGVAFTLRNWNTATKIEQLLNR